MYTQAELFEFEDKEYRETYVSAHVESSIAQQIRLLREDRGLSQAGSADLIGTTQSAVSRMESCKYGRLTVNTLLTTAHAYDVALVVKFVSFKDFLKESDDVTNASLTAKPYSPADISTGTVTTEVVKNDAWLDGSACLFSSVLQQIDVLYVGQPDNPISPKVTHLITGSVTQPSQRWSPWIRPNQHEKSAPCMPSTKAFVIGKIEQQSISATVLSV